MRIYKMTATFGKLSHAQLVLEPGLNIIHAPNEWGKSTWCAFLLTMLYGLDTRAKSSKSALGDRERYAPWSGSPMEGRLDICWQGRDITIERRTRGRIPMGEFAAYETDTGILVPELNAHNCGEKLLGVERSVYRRAGFLRLSDLPVTQDEALLARLNALVTTGDESGEGERLEGKLRELRNRLRYNRSGLIPQSQERLAELEQSRRELAELEQAASEAERRMQALEEELAALEVHQRCLAYREAREGQRQVELAQKDWQEKERELEGAEEACLSLPPREECQQKLLTLTRLRDSLARLRQAQEELPPVPPKPETPSMFRGMSPQEARLMVREDRETFEDLTTRKPQRLWLILGLLAALAAVVFGVLRVWIPMGLWSLCGTAALMAALSVGKKRKKALEGLAWKYGTPEPERWQRRLDIWYVARVDHEHALAANRQAMDDLELQLALLRRERESLCGKQSVEQTLEIWQEAEGRYARRDALREEARQRKGQYEALRSVAKPVQPTDKPDPLDLSAEETRRNLDRLQGQRQHLLTRRAELSGQMQALGSAGSLDVALEAERKRLARLEETYQAAQLGLAAMARAKEELQRRFAPKIARRAQEWMARLTGGRYDRLTLGPDLTLSAGAAGEDTLRSALWRSEGTVDQLYLALRLAVAEALTEDAPLVLDDALVRFDDVRLQAALEVLKELSQHRQVILFTCQQRETTYAGA